MSNIKMQRVHSILDETFNKRNIKIIKKEFDSEHEYGAYAAYNPLTHTLKLFLCKILSSSEEMFICGLTHELGHFKTYGIIKKTMLIKNQKDKAKESFKRNEIETAEQILKEVENLKISLEIKAWINGRKFLPNDQKIKNMYEKINKNSLEKQKDVMFNILCNECGILSKKT